jgi:hypothetical protein
MIRINISSDGVAKAGATGAAIKAGGSVPVEIVFAVSTVATSLALALGPQSSAIAVLAYTDGFTSENGTTYRGILNCNDSRLIAAVDGKESLPVVCEVRWTEAGVTQIAVNFGLTVQAPIVTGPEATEGGPEYYTTTESDARFLKASDGLAFGSLTTLAGLATTSLVAGVVRLAVHGGQGGMWQLTAGADATNEPWVKRPDDFNAETNAKVWKRIL